MDRADVTDRRGLERAFAAELERSRRGDEQFALVLVELDGELVANGDGDPVERVATGLVTVTRLFDVVAHVEASRFTVILPGSDSDGGCALAGRLRATVGASGRVPVPLSVGVAQFPEHGGSAALLERSATLALGKAKRLGGNRCEQYTFELEETALELAPDDASLTLSELLDLLGPSPLERSRRVASYAERTALQLGLRPEHAARVRLAGLLHDVGKAGVPSAIVGRAGPLDADQSEEARAHPEIGARLVEGTDHADVAAWILAHHERPDGRGYPAGLAADEIPLEASILGVADAYVAMTSDRAHRGAMSAAAARDELERAAGTQFDAQVVRAFLTLGD